MTNLCIMDNSAHEDHQKPAAISVIMTRILYWCKVLDNSNTSCMHAPVGVTRKFEAVLERRTDLW